MMIFGTRNLKPANKWLTGQKGNDKAIDVAVENGKKAFSGSEISGKTLGALKTTIPLLAHFSIGILLNPAPARPMANSSFENS